VEALGDSLSIHRWRHRSGIDRTISERGKCLRFSSGLDKGEISTGFHPLLPQDLNYKIMGITAYSTYADFFAL
jgi:hypothetical protein